MSETDVQAKNGNGKTGQILINGRSAMEISGVKEVISFDEEGVRLQSIDGELYIEGSDIKIGTLDTDRGYVTVSGRINGLYYAQEADERKKRRFGRGLG